MSSLSFDSFADPRLDNRWLQFNAASLRASLHVFPRERYALKLANAKPDGLDGRFG
jgi:hypothetical protein